MEKEIWSFSSDTTKLKSFRGSLDNTMKEFYMVVMVLGSEIGDWTWAWQRETKQLIHICSAKYKQEQRAVSPRVWCVLSVCSVARVFRCCWQGHSPPLRCSPRPAVSPDPHRPCIHCRQMLRGIAIQLIQLQDNCRDLHEIFFCFRSKYFRDMYCVSLYLDLDTVHRISTSSALEFRIIYEFNF